MFTIIGAIHGSSRDKLYQELGFESLQDRRFRKLCFYYKISEHNGLVDHFFVLTIIIYILTSYLQFTQAGKCSSTFDIYKQ